MYLQEKQREENEKINEVLFGNYLTLEEALAHCDVLNERTSSRFYFHKRSKSRLNRTLWSVYSVPLRYKDEVLNSLGSNKD